jgi:hypothetical protein
VDYFWDVGQLAILGGWLPEALGYWLPSRLKKGSPVQTWFSTLSTGRQLEMRSHYLAFLSIVKEKYLGKKWQLVMNLQFEQQSFRQEGHDKELPQSFINRRIRFVRTLTNSDDGGPLEVTSPKNLFLDSFFSNLVQPEIIIFVYDVVDSCWNHFHLWVENVAF